MASEKKKKKLKNSGGSGGVLKNKDLRLKRNCFFTSSQRKAENIRCPGCGAKGGRQCNPVRTTCGY